jgi:glycosyltransferase involved in cell wall biosynthesis
VVVPAFNEAENIPLLVEKFGEMFHRSRLKGEVIIVNDGSTDDTLQRANEATKRYRFLRIVSHKVNRGLTAALETGFALARGKILLLWPADLQYMPEEIPKMVARIEDGYDVVCGWKQGKYGLKRFASFFYNMLSRAIFKVRVHDLNSVKAFRKEVIEDMPHLREGWHRYLVVLAAQKGYKIGEVKVKLYPRKYGKSKFGFWRIPIGISDLFSVKFQMSFLRKPLLFFGAIGFTLGFLGLLIGLVAIYFRFFSGIEGWFYRPLLYLVVLLESMGLMLFMLGFLAEAMIYFQDELSSLRRENKRIVERLESLGDIQRKVRSLQPKRDRPNFSRGKSTSDSRGGPASPERGGPTSNERGGPTN